MAEFLKLNFVDHDCLSVEKIKAKAKDLESLLKSELKRYKANDRLESIELSISGNTIRHHSGDVTGPPIAWLPSDGSCPIIAAYIESPSGCFDNGNSPDWHEIREYFKDYWTKD